MRFMVARSQRRQCGASTTKEPQMNFYDALTIIVAATLVARVVL